MGITDADVVANKYPCISDLAGGALIEEQDGRALTTPTSIVPFSIASYDAEQAQTETDLDSGAILGSINGINPQQINSTFPVTREVYNVVPTTDVGTAPWSTTFVGSTSAVCTNSATITLYGFTVAPDCGSTTSVTAP